MNEALIYGIKLTLSGIVIVFLVLAFIALSVSLVRILDKQWEKREAKEKDEAKTQPPTIDEITLLLITAAVSTILVGRFHIKNVHRVVQTSRSSNSWTQQGRSILHGSHRLHK